MTVSSPSIDSPRLLGAVLCGGRSRRMGRDKRWLPHAGGKTFLEHAARRLESVCDHVCLVAARDWDAGQDGERLRSLGFPLLADAFAKSGPAAGVTAALRWAKDRGDAACLVFPVDVPELTVSDLQRLRDVWLTGPHRLVAARATDHDHPEPLVAIYPVGRLEEIETLAASEDRSLRRWLGQQPHEPVALPSSHLHNVNRPEDLSGG